MNLRSSLLGMFYLFGYLSLIAQSETTVVQFEFTFAGEPFQLNKSYYVSALEDSIQLETIRFYIFDPHLVVDNERVASAVAQYYLLDAAVPSSLELTFPDPVTQPLATLKFNLGIDSLTNVDGARGGALDPINGLYWSWQSGYINVKIEGTSTACPTRNNRFQYHLGGYQAPNNSLQEVAIKVPTAAVIRVEIKLEEYFEQINLGEVNQIMSPSPKAVALANLFATSIKHRP